MFHNVSLTLARTINSIRRKDPSIYDSENVFFEREGKNIITDKEKEEENEEKESAHLKHKSKKYKDLLREQLLVHGAGGEIDLNHRYTFVLIDLPKQSHC